MGQATYVPITDNESTSSPIDIADTHLSLRSFLSAAEWEVAIRILKGHSTRQIADYLFRSTETIQNHRKNIRHKLGVRGGKLALVNFLRDHINE